MEHCYCFIAEVPDVCTGGVCCSLVILVLIRRGVSSLQRRLASLATQLEVVLQKTVVGLGGLVGLGGWIWLVGQLYMVPQLEAQLEGGLPELEPDTACRDCSEKQ